MSNFSRSLSIFIAGFLLVSCSSAIDCDVVCYHDLGAPAGERVSVIANPDSPTAVDQFEEVAKQIRFALDQAGYTAVQAGFSDLVFVINYGVGAGPDEQERMSRCADNYVFKDDEYGAPYYSGLQCYEQTPELINNYLHFLEVKVFDGIAITSDDPDALYEGLVQSLSWSDDQQLIMPYLVAALFDNFPGESGKVRRVTVSFDEARSSDE